MASLLLGIAVGNIRWPVSPTVSATDATPDSGGTTHTNVSVDLAEHLYQACEYTGCPVRLDERVSPLVSQPPRDALLEGIVRSCDWKFERSHDCGFSAHVNLQEMRELREEIIARATQVQPQLVVNLSDSKVTVCAFAKRCSSGYRLNNIFRKALGHLIFGFLAFANLWIASEVNPSDDPSRFTPLRKRLPPASWLAPLLRPESLRWNLPPRRVANQFRVLGEIFSGKASLSHTP